MPRNIIEEILRIRVRDEELKRHKRRVQEYGRAAKRAFDRVRVAGRKAFTAMQTGMKRLSSAVRRNMALIKRWARRGVIVALAAVALAFGKAVVDAAKFSARMADVGNLMNATSKQIALFRESVLTMYQAIAAGNLREFASALYNINSAGFRAAKGLIVLAASSKLAIAAATSVDVSTRVLTKVLNIYRKEAELATDVTDMLVATVAQAESNLQDMAAAIPTVLPQARAAQISLEETLGVFAVLTKTANSPETAAVQFDRMINSLGESVDRLRELGLDVNDFGLTEGGLVDTVFQLVDKLGHGNVAGLREIFNEIRGFRAVLGLLVQGQENVNAAVEEVGNSTGETARDFGKMREEATLVAKSLKNELHAALVALGLKALPAAVRWMEKFRTALRGVLGTMQEGAVRDRSAFLEQFNLSPDEITSQLNALRNTRNEMRMSLLEAQDQIARTPFGPHSADARAEEEHLTTVLNKLDIEIAAREMLLKQAKQLAEARERDAAAMAEEKRVAEEVQKALLDAQRQQDAYDEGLPGSIREAQRMYGHYVELAEKATDQLQKQEFYLKAIVWQHKLLQRETRAGVQRIVDVDSVATAAPGIPLDPSALEPVLEQTLTRLSAYEKQINAVEEALAEATIGSQQFYDLQERSATLKKQRDELMATGEAAKDLYESFVDLGQAFSNFFDTAEVGSPLFRDLLYGATKFAGAIKQLKDAGGISSLSGAEGASVAIGVIGPLIGVFGNILSSFKERSQRDEERAKQEHETRKRLLEALEQTAMRIGNVIRKLRDIDIYGAGLSGAEGERAAFHAQGLRSTTERAQRDPSGASIAAFDFATHLKRLVELGVAGAQDFLDLYEQELARTGSRAEAMQAVLNAGLEGWLTQLENFGDFAPTVAGATRELDIFIQFLGGTATAGLRKFVEALLKIDGLTPELRKLLEEAGGLDPNNATDKARLDEILAYIASNPQIWGALRPADVFDFLGTIQGLGDGTFQPSGRESRDSRTARQITEITGSTLVEIAREQLAELRNILEAIRSPGRLGAGGQTSGSVASPPTVRPPVIGSIPQTMGDGGAATGAITIGDVTVIVDGDPAHWSPGQVNDAADRIGEALEDVVRQKLGSHRNIRRRR